MRSPARHLMLIIGGGAGLLSCGGGGAVGPDQPKAVFSALVLSPDSITLAAGGGVQLTVAPRDQNGAAMTGLPAPTLTVEDPAIASLSGTVLSGVAAGSTRLFATLTVGAETHADTSRVVVSDAPSGGPAHPVTTVGTTFAPNSLTIVVGDSVSWVIAGATHNVTFTTASKPAGGDIPDTPSGTTVSRIFTGAGVYAYECTIHSGMTAQVVVQSGQTQVFTSVSVTPATATLQTGGAVQLAATPLDQSGVPMTGLAAPSFTSGNIAIASVDAQGLVTAVGAGTTNVTAAITSAGVTHSATATIIVSTPVPGGVTVTTPNLTFSPPSVAIAVGGTVTWAFSGNTHNVTFTGAAPAGGNIPDQPAGSSQSRTFTTSGNYAYVCTRHNGMTGTVVVSGGGGTPVYTSLQLTPQSPLVSVGASVPLTATPLDQNGAPMTGLPAATFASADATVATVNLTGLVTAVSIGSTTITATLTSGGVTHTAQSAVTVGSPASATITTPNLTFAPDDITIAPGQTVLWSFSGTTHNVTFETIAPPGGNIPDMTPGTSVSRTFPQVGDYKYFCSIHSNMKGRVRVK